MTAPGEETQGRNGDRRPIVYCLVPRELARLHEPLRRHFRDERGVEVVVERRAVARRSSGERRTTRSERETERRRVRNVAGRRVGERRAALVEIECPAPPSGLPRAARRHADSLVFVERLEPAGQELEDIDTSRLVLRIQAGDREAFGDLYQRYFDRVYNYLRIGLDDPHEAEDATQHVFVKVLEALPRYERRAQPFRGWLFVIVRNTLLKQLPTRDRFELTDPSDLGRQRADAEVDDSSLHALGWISDRELLMFIERLPASQRQVLVLRYMLGLSSEEAAQVLDRSAADVRTLQSRALRFLRTRLASVGRTSVRGKDIRVRGWVKPAQVLRNRRFALLR